MSEQLHKKWGVGCVKPLSQLTKFAPQLPCCVGRERSCQCLRLSTNRGDRLALLSVSARIKGWPSLPALSARRSFPDQCIMFQNTQKMIPQHGQTVVAGDKFHAAGERSAWLSPRFVLNGRQWQLRSVQTCQSSRSQRPA